MRLTEAIEFLSGRADRELLTHYDPDLDIEDTKKARKKKDLNQLKLFEGE